MANDENLDQLFTTAGIAMMFAVDNWQLFSEFTASTIERLPPLSREQMNLRALRILLMADPERMPDGV